MRMTSIMMMRVPTLLLLQALLVADTRSSDFAPATGSRRGGGGGATRMRGDGRRRRRNLCRRGCHQQDSLRGRSPCQHLRRPCFAVRRGGNRRGVHSPRPRIQHRLRRRQIPTRVAVQGRGVAVLPQPAGRRSTQSFVDHQSLGL